MTGGEGEKKEFKVKVIRPPALTIELLDASNVPMGGVSCLVSVDGKEEDKVTDDSGKIGTLRPQKSVKITLEKGE